VSDAYGCNSDILTAHHPINGCQWTDDLNPLPEKLKDLQMANFLSVGLRKSKARADRLLNFQTGPSQLAGFMKGIVLASDRAVSGVS
jgi:hypothetical protein